MKRLSVIIPSRNINNLTRCLAAVWTYEPSMRIIVVDDGLECRPVPALLHYLSGVKPFIFARNVNLGIRAAGDDDIIILNDDALLKTSGGFTAMQMLAESNPDYGVIASTCNNVGNQAQWPMGTPWLREEHRTLCFVCVLIPRHTIEKVGLLDERFVDYGLDDDDYSLRVRQAGLKLGIFDGCYVDHGSLTSSYRGEAGAGGNFLPNMKRFIEKWGVDNWGQPRETSQFRDLFPC